MAEGKWISYLRVSTKRQGRSGLGLEAQRHAVAGYLDGGDWSLVKEFVEVESGKRDSNRPMLAEALKACRVYGAKLVIAKLDRLSRNAPFLLGLRDAGIDFVCCDMPNANRLTVGIMALVAEDERERISERTKQALAAARRRGVKLGGARGVVPSRKARALAAEAVQERVAARASDLAPIIAELQAVGITSWEGIARRLTDDGIKTARGKSTWSATQAGRLLARLSTP